MFFERFAYNCGIFFIDSYGFSERDLKMRVNCISRLDPFPLNRDSNNSERTCQSILRAIKPSRSYEFIGSRIRYVHTCQRNI